MNVVVSLWVFSGVVTTTGTKSGVTGTPHNASDDHCVFTMNVSTNYSSPDSDPLITAIEHLLDNLQWNKIIFFYDDSSYNLQQELLESIHDTPGLLSLIIHRLPSDLQSTSEIHDLLHIIHRKSFPVLHIVLISTYNRSYELLRLVEQLDLMSRRTIDYRHYSFWIVVCIGQCQPGTGVLPDIQQLENVALVSSLSHEELFNGSEIPAKIFTLTSVPGGRAFTLTNNLGHVTRREMHGVIFPNVKYGFNNRTLTVSVMKSNGMMNIDNGYSGYLKEILDAMATKLNFSYIIGLPPDRRWGYKSNNSWDGLIGQLVRREVDLVVSTVTIHQEREEDMDFLLPPTFTEVYDLIYRLQEDQGQEWQIYFKPFQSVVLFTILVSLLVLTVIAAILISQENVIMNEQKRKRKHRVWLVAEMFFYLFGLLLVKGVSSRPSMCTLRLLFFTWGIFSLVISSVFCANLVAFFASKKETLPFRSLAELIDQDDYKFGMESGDVREAIFRNTKYGDVKDAWEKIVKMNRSDPDVLHRELKVHTAKMFAEKYAYVTSRRFGSEHVSKDCRVRLVGANVMWHQYGIGVPQDYPPKRDMERLLSLMADNGLLDIWYKRWKVVHENKCAVDNNVKMLVLTDVQTAFYALCGGLVLAGGTLFVENIIRNRFA